MFSLLRRAPVTVCSRLSFRQIHGEAPFLEMMDKAAEEQKVPVNNNKRIPGRGSKNHMRAQMLWKPFALNRHITPHTLTLKAHQKVRPQPKKRPALGPSGPVSRYLDPFHQLNLDPLKEACNPKLMTAYVSEMGKIHGREVSNLTWRNQRRLAKAIRRAKMMGVIPLLSKTLYWDQRDQKMSLRRGGTNY